MPRVPIDYSKCIIYKIVCLDEKVDEIYVGHTTDFKSRKNAHKDSCNCENNKKYNLKLYQYIRANGGWDNFNMIPIEEYPCENSTQARIKEEEIRLKLQAQLNSHRAYLSEEIRKIRDAKIKKQLYEENKELILEQQNQYRKENREQIIKKLRQIYEKNKKEILEKRKQKYTCECGSTIVLCQKLRHERSKKHQAFLDLKA